MSPVIQDGIVTIRSHYSVADTTDRLESVLADHGIKVFCRIDHAQEAAQVGLTMRPTVLLVFGNPKAGTPLMLDAPSIALDLPLKALVWQGPTGDVWISYNAPEYLRDRHHVSAYLMQNIGSVKDLIRAAAGASAEAA